MTNEQICAIGAISSRSFRLVADLTLRQFASSLSDLEMAVMQEISNWITDLNKIICLDQFRKLSRDPDNFSAIIKYDIFIYIYISSQIP